MTMDMTLERAKRRDIQLALRAAQAIVIRLRAMKRNVGGASYADFRKALVYDLNDLNYRTQTL